MRARTENLGSDIHSSACLVRRNIFGVEGNSGFYSGDEQVGRYRRDRDNICRMLHPYSIAIRSEDLNIAGRITECLKAFVGLLTIVQSRGHAMDADIGISHELKRRPLASLYRVVRLNMPIY